jgi:putative membrane protein
MRFVAWVLRIAIFAAVLLFAVANNGTNVELNLGFERVRQPVVLFLLVFFVAGVVTGLLSVVPALYRRRREIGRLKKEIRVGSVGVENAAAAPSPDVPTLTHSPNTNTVVPRSGP